MGDVDICGTTCIYNEISAMEVCWRWRNFSNHRVACVTETSHLDIHCVYWINWFWCVSCYQWMGTMVEVDVYISRSPIQELYRHGDGNSLARLTRPNRSFENLQSCR